MSAPDVAPCPECAALRREVKELRLDLEAVDESHWNARQRLHDRVKELGRELEEAEHRWRQRA